MKTHAFAEYSSGLYITILSRHDSILILEIVCVLFELDYLRL